MIDDVIDLVFSVMMIVLLVSIGVIFAALAWMIVRTAAL